MRLALTVCIAALTLSCLAPAAGFAETTVSAEQQAKTRINVAGRQRMLSQRMAKAACFAHIGQDRQGHVTMLAAADNLFQESHQALRQGSAELGLSPETHGEILSKLSDVGLLWTELHKANQTVTGTGAVPADTLRAIAQTAGPLLKRMHKTVGVIERIYGSNETMHPTLARAINIAGRQRMLSQKASMEFCMVLTNENREAYRQSLQATVSLFQSSLDGLISGNATLALAPAPTPEIQNQLQKVSALWQPLRSILEATAKGATPTPAHIALIARDNNTLLKEMNKAVGMYSSL